MKTTGTYCMGGGLVEVGALAAGFVPLWGVEHDDDIAQVARNNGLHAITANVCAIDPSALQWVYHFHASPPCPSFSPAKTGGEETREDVAIARAAVRYIEAQLPTIFTLENVSMYRFSESWRLIQNALDRLGYWMDVQNHLNMADFGVPQTRKRMIVRAIRGGHLPPLPQPAPWRGWYQAVEDLLHGLEDSEFAPWQLASGVQDLLDQSRLFFQGSFKGNGNYGAILSVPARQPAFTVTANRNMNSVRAFLVTGQYGQPNSVPDRRCQTRNDSEPSPTVTASTKSDWRAFIVDSCNASQAVPTIRTADEPTFTVVASAAEKGMPRAAIPGRVVKMSPRCLARLQTIPDDYVLPDNATLAVRVVGNAVPPLFYQQLIAAITRQEATQ